MRKIKAVAIAESLDPKTKQADYIQCLGVFESFEAAYGNAIIYLTELAIDTYEQQNKNEECAITPLRDLEAETGFGLYLKNKAGETLDAVFILHANAPELEDGGESK